MKVKVTIATSIGVIFADVVEAATTGEAMRDYQQRPEVAAKLEEQRYAPWCVQGMCFDPLPDARVPGAVQADVAKWRAIEAARQALEPEEEDLAA